MPEFKREEIKMQQTETLRSLIFCCFYIYTGTLGLFFFWETKWRHGTYIDTDLVFASGLYLLAALSHYRAFTSRRCRVLPHHFREQSQKYQLQCLEDNDEDQAQEGFSPFKECHLCNCIKVIDSENFIFVNHCTTCDTCMLNMDHHCHFTSSCVDLSSTKLFVLLMFYTFLMTANLFRLLYLYISSQGPIDFISLFTLERKFEILSWTFVLGCMIYWLVLTSVVIGGTISRFK